MAFAPILISFSCKLVSNQAFTVIERLLHEGRIELLVPDLGKIGFEVGESAINTVALNCRVDPLDVVMAAVIIHHRNCPRTSHRAVGIPKQNTVVIRTRASPLSYNATI